MSWDMYPDSAVEYLLKHGKPEDDVNDGIELDHITLQDDSLTHQVRFTHRAVSCNCRATVGDHEKAGKVFYEPMDGQSATLDQARVLYNDPANHYQPFDPAVDGAQW